nr:MAG TPA: Receptor recognition protein, Long tail, Helical sandwich, Tail fiber [Caudoviricetes sp.]
MIKPFKKKIRRNYLDLLIKGFNSMSDKLDEVIEQVNEYEKRIKELEKGSERK